ncbi:MAG TPA: hypothetical protein VGO58_03545, partial [Chitinophagaceae bacterium]|nr:hypothetical protein [Chitinophagaceae bacterium]
MTKEYIIEAYEKLKKKLGKQPSMKELLKHTSVTHRSLLKVGFRTYSELVELMGDTPKEFINPPRP